MPKRSDSNKTDTATAVEQPGTQKEQVPVRLDLLPADGFVRLPVVLLATGLSRSQVYLNAKKRRFPSPHKLSAHASGWRVSDIRNWLSDPTGWLPPVESGGKR